MKYWVYVAMLVGCRYEFDDLAPCTFTYATCPATTPAPSMTIDGVDRIDTDSDPRCATSDQPDGPDLCTIFVGGLKITATGQVIATGSRPLFFAAAGDISIEGSIDVSSRHGDAPGAGASWAVALPICAPARLPDANTGGGGGAAGGSFGARGGAGGAGNADGPNALGGQTNMTDPVPLVIRGGCFGGVGGADGSPTSGGASGAAGGAVYIAAADAIFVSGTIAAGGSGGGGGGATVGDGGAGAGGGGAGGMIVLEATTITIGSTAILAANGGGGGGGGGTMVTDGADASVDAQRAPGASAVNSGGAGGAGGAGAASDGDPAGPLPLGGGGGGGGSVGVIRLLGAASVAGTISPPPG